MMGDPLALARGDNPGNPRATKTAAGIMVAWSERNPISEIHVGLLQTA